MDIEVDPRIILDKYRIDYCLFAQEEPIVKVLPLVSGWKRVYSDKQAVIFEREY